MRKLKNVYKNGQARGALRGQARRLAHARQLRLQASLPVERHSVLEWQANFYLAHVFLAKGCCAAAVLRTTGVSRARHRVPLATRGGALTRASCVCKPACP